MLSRFVSIKTSIGADGLGVPTVSVFLSGCDKKQRTGKYCDGCHNLSLKDDGIGHYLDIETVERIVNEKISFQKALFGECELAIIGGEPLSELNRNFSIELAKRIDVNTIVFTWREIEDLKNEKIDISHFNRIVCGEFRDDLNNDGYILGSTNQYLIDSEFKIIIKYEGDK